MISFIDSSHILNRSQYGFRANHDCIDAVSVLTSNALQAMDNNMITIAIMVDISKAFDNLDHKILLDKLSHYGFRGCSLQWFSSFLSGRSQVTCYNSTLPSLLPIISGVPKGAVLSPLLFSLFVNDLPININSNVIQFADDTTIFASGRDAVDVIHSLNTDLNTFSAWCNQNFLKVNIQKTKAICLKKRTTRPNLSIPLIFNNVPIPFSDSVQLLGIHLDPDLCWNAHISYLHKDLAKICYLLNTLKHILPKASLKQLYFALFFSKLSYGLLLYGSATKTLLSPLFILQKKSHSICLFC